MPSRKATAYVASAILAFGGVSGSVDLIDVQGDYLHAYCDSVYDTPSGRLEDGYQSELTPVSPTTTPKKIARITGERCATVYFDGFERFEKPYDKASYERLGEPGGARFNPGPDTHKITMAQYAFRALSPKKTEAAISFDAATSPGSSTGTSYTFPLTTAGPDAYVEVCLFRNGAADITGRTFNGDTLTQKPTSPLSNWECSYLFNADVVAGNVVITRSTSQTLNPTAVAYKCVDTSGFDSNGSFDGEGTVTSWSRDVTINTANAWGLVGIGKTAAQTATAGTLRSQGTGDSAAIIDNGPASPSAVTISATSASSDTYLWPHALKPSTSGGCVPSVTPQTDGIIFFD